MFRVTLCSSVHHCTWVLLVKAEYGGEAFGRAIIFLRRYVNNYQGSDEYSVKALPSNYKVELDVAQMECLMDRNICILECNN